MYHLERSSHLILAGEIDRLNLLMLFECQRKLASALTEV